MLPDCNVPVGITRAMVGAVERLLLSKFPKGFFDFGWCLREAAGVNQDKYHLFVEQPAGHAGEHGRPARAPKLGFCRRDAVYAVDWW